MNRYILLDAFQYLKNKVVVNITFTNMTHEMDKNRIWKIVFISSDENTNHSLYLNDFLLVSSRIEATTYGPKPVMRFSKEWAKNRWLQDLQFVAISIGGEDNIKDACINMHRTGDLNITCPYQMTEIYAEFHSMSGDETVVKLHRKFWN